MDTSSTGILVEFPSTMYPLVQIWVEFCLDLCGIAGDVDSTFEHISNQRILRETYSQLRETYTQLLFWRKRPCILTNLGPLYNIIHNSIIKSYFLKQEVPRLSYLTFGKSKYRE